MAQEEQAPDTTNQDLPESEKDGLVESVEAEEAFDTEESVEAEEAFDTEEIAEIEEVGHAPAEVVAVEEFALRTAVTADGSKVELRAGYQFKHPDLFVFLKKEKVTSKNLTHKNALRILRGHAKWFRQNVRRGYYPLNDTYWS